MESRIIVPMNLFARKEWRHRCRERTVDAVGEGPRATEGKVASTYVHHRSRVDGCTSCSAAPGPGLR